MEERTPLSHKDVCFQMLDFGNSKTNSKVSNWNVVENYFCYENYVTSETAVSQNVLYYQQVSIACYQVSFYANNYLE